MSLHYLQERKEAQTFPVPPKVPGYEPKVRGKFAEDIENAVLAGEPLIAMQAADAWVRSLAFGKSLPKDVVGSIAEKAADTVRTSCKARHSPYSVAALTESIIEQAFAEATAN
jgi:hypothetical protein